MADSRFTIELIDSTLVVKISESQMKNVASDNEPWRSIEAYSRSPTVESLLLDVKQVEFMSSVILGKIVGIRRKFQGEITLMNLNPFLYEIFRVTGLHKLFNLASSPEGTR